VSRVGLLAPETGFPDAVEGVHGFEVLRLGAAVVAEEHLTAHLELRRRAHAGSDANVVVVARLLGFPVLALCVAELEVEHAVFETARSLHAELRVRDVVDELKLLHVGRVVVGYEGGACLVEGGGTLVGKDR
jgi:hypothetical protein